MKIKLLIMIYFVFFIFQNKGFSDLIGRVIQLSGTIERSSITTGQRYNTDIGSQVDFGQRIKLQNDSYIEILYENGTSILISDESEVLLYSIRMKVDDAPTKIKLLYGKIKVIPRQVFNDRSLILTTPTAIISIVDATFSAIASENETKIVSFSSKVGIASINPGIKKAYIIFEGEEISVKKNIPPSSPVGITDTVIKFWMDNYIISSDHKYILKINQEEGFIDWILRKREY